MQVGVPVVPGTPGPIAAYTDAAKFIEENGFPSTSSAVNCKRKALLIMLYDQSSSRPRWAVVDVACVSSVSKVN